MPSNKMPDRAPSILEDVFAVLPVVWPQHAPTERLYALFKRVARREVEQLFSGREPASQPFQPFGELCLPYHNMGAVDSLNLFNLDELIIFSFYWRNRKRYHRVLDIGANLGLHAIIMDRCGFEVRAYEPDPVHFEILQRNLALNRCTRVQPCNTAISRTAGELEFVRVLGNTTGSHLAGSKPNPYGELQRFPVKVEAIEPLMAWADLIKLDAEGHEKEILLATRREQWTRTDAVVEVGNPGNAAAIHDHFHALGVNLFAQKLGWARVEASSQMPMSHHDGSLFITMKTQVPWAGPEAATADDETALVMTQ